MRTSVQQQRVAAIGQRERDAAHFGRLADACREVADWLGRFPCRNNEQQEVIDGLRRACDDGTREYAERAADAIERTIPVRRALGGDQ